MHAPVLQLALHVVQIMSSTEETSATLSASATALLAPAQVSAPSAIQALWLILTPAFVFHVPATVTFVQVYQFVPLAVPTTI